MDAPRQGLIVFEDPAPRAGVARRGTQRGLSNIQPSKIVYVALGDDESETLEHQAQTGVLEYRGGVERRLPIGEIEKQMRNPHLTRSRPIVLKAEEFASLWATLEEVGLFTLPEYHAKEPPADRAYFLVDDTRRQRIFVRPEATRDGRSRLDQERFKAWRDAKVVIVYGGVPDAVSPP